MAVAQTSVATDKRFRRAHVKPSRKRSPASKHAWLAARVLIIVLLLGYASYRGVSMIAEASSLQIGHMTVRGHERLSTGEVLALVEGLRGQNILTVSLEQWQEKLLSSPWVEGATIRRVLPSTVEISIHERRPMGIGRLGTAMYLIDGRGVIIDEYGPAYADIDLPIIDGIGAVTVLLVLVDAFVQRVPRERRALHAHGELRDALQRLEVAERFRRGRVGLRHHLLELVRQIADLRDGLALHQVRHHRRGCLADRAAASAHADAGEPRAIEVQLHLDLVAAHGVVALGGDVGAFDLLPVAGVLVVVQDQVPVKLIELQL